jgi:hypothetical protein
MTISLKDKLKVLFRDLRRKEFIARMNLEKSDEDARNIILDEYNKSNKNAPRAVFFTKLDITNNQTNIKYFHLKNDKEKEVEKEILKQLMLHFIDYKYKNNK